MKRICDPCPETCGTQEPEKCRIIITDRKNRQGKAEPDLGDLLNGPSGSRITNIDCILSEIHDVWKTLLALESKLLTMTYADTVE